MNNLISNFVGFDGRINRQKWWIGVIILAVLGIVLSWILNAILGVNGANLVAADGSVDMAAVQSMAQRAGWAGLIASLVLTYPALALNMKRRHDRNNNGYDVIALTVLSILSNLLTGLGIASMANPVGIVVSLVVLVLGLYLLVQLGFLKGTAGANAYGPDPLGG